MECEAAVGDVFNIGSSEEVTIEQLADRVIALTGSDSIKKFVPYEIAYGRPIEDMMRRVPGTERIGDLIGWKPKTTLDQTLEMIIDEQRRQEGTP